MFYGAARDERLSFAASPHSSFTPTWPPLLPNDPGLLLYVTSGCSERSPRGCGAAAVSHRGEQHGRWRSGFLPTSAFAIITEIVPRSLANASVRGVV